MAHRQGLIFGQNIVWTYGPLAFLNYPEAGLVSPVLVLSWNFAIYGASIFCLAKLVRRIRSHYVAMIMLLVLILASALRLASGSGERIQIAFLLAIWLVIAGLTFTDIPAFAIAGILAGVSVLVKVNDGVINLAVFYSVYAFAWLRDSRLSARVLGLGLVPLATVLLLFSWASGGLMSFPNYLHYSLSIANGYSEAMSTIGPLWQTVLAVFSMATLAMLLTWRLENRRIWCSYLPTALLALAAFKHCMVRQDDHAIVFHSELGLAAILGLLVAVRKRQMALGIFALANVATAVLIIHHQSAPTYDNATRFLSLRLLPNNLRAYLTLDASWKNTETATAAALAPLMAGPEIRNAIDGASMEDLTWNEDFIRANHFRWKPSPVFQFYAAFKPDLDLLNARSLSYKGPEFATLRFQEIDGRHPFLEGPATWRAILDHYDLAGGGLDMLLLKRRVSERFSRMKPIPHGETVFWSEQFDVPESSSNKVIVLTATTGLSLWGKLCNTFFRVDPVYLEATYKSGLTTKFRVVRPNLAEGAIISDLPQSLAQMLPLFGYQQERRDPIIKLRWLADHPAEFQTSIRITWSSMAVSDDEGPLIPELKPDASAFVPLWLPAAAIAGSPATAVEVRPDEIVLRPTGADPQVLLRTSSELAPYKCILIRAKFSVRDQINVFFGRQIEGRGFAGYVPEQGQWVDVFVRTDRNPFWRLEAGRVLRFDPVTSLYAGSHIELAGVWGSLKPLGTAGSEEMTFYLSRTDGPLSRK